MDVITSIAGFLLTAIAVVGGICVYLLPSIVAAYRAHPHWLTIAVVNVLTGWTGLGWIAALVWSFVTPELWRRTIARGEKLSQLSDPEK